MRAVCGQAAEKHHKMSCCLATSPFTSMIGSPSSHPADQPCKSSIGTLHQFGASPVSVFCFTICGMYANVDLRDPYARRSRVTYRLMACHVAFPDFRHSMLSAILSYRILYHLRTHCMCQTGNFLRRTLLLFFGGILPARPFMSLHNLSRAHY